MKTTIVFGNAHTPEAIEKFQREHAAEIEEMIASGALDRPADSDADHDVGAEVRGRKSAPREERKAA